ncbi:MAG: Gldg family protein [Aestuariibacter sp.]
MKASKTITYLLLFVVFFAATLFNNVLFKGARIDLTENQVYSLSDGSKALLQEIDEPINLYFFYSKKTSEGLTTLRNYADRVESLLKEYESAADGKIILHLVDPEPFSEAEDQAADFGLTAAQAGMAGDSIYLGLAGRNALDDEEIIGFFDPQKEQFLEYDISKLIYQLSDPDPIQIGLISGVNMTGGQNPMTGQFDSPWAVYSQLQQMFTLDEIQSDAESLPEGLDVLMVVHPKGLSEKLLFAIDQYAMSGGKLLLFLDPHHESDPMSAMSGMGGANTSEFGGLLQHWGAQFNGSEVVLDAALGLDIRSQSGGVTKHLGFIGLTQQLFNSEDVTTASLDSINGASFGSFTVQENTKVNVTPLVTSSDYSGNISNMLYAATRDPEQLFEHYNQATERSVLAVRLSGKASSFFDTVPEGIQAELLSNTENLNVVAVADTDFLTDRFWVNQANFFGQTILTPFADNGAFVSNALENLSGNNALISVRSRGTYARPFEKVAELTVVAEARFREQEQALEAELAETEQQLAELQTGQSEEMLVLNEEQQAAIENFMDKKIEIRKKLREVRHQLDKDIEALGSQLQFINIIVMPILLVIGLFFMQRTLRLKAKS